MGLRRKTHIDDFRSKNEHAMIGDNMRKVTRGRPERSALRTVRRCRRKESKDVFEIMKKLERDIREQEPQ